MARIYHLELSEDERDAVEEALEHFLRRWPNEGNRLYMESALVKLARLIGKSGD